MRNNMRYRKEKERAIATILDNQIGRRFTEEKLESYSLPTLKYICQMLGLSINQ